MKDYGKMLLNELAPVYESVQLKDDKCFSIRPNLGQGFIPSLFGCRNEISDAKLDSLPWVVHEEGRHNKTALKRMIDEGLPEIQGEMLGCYREIVEDWLEVLSDYPNLSRFCHITLPDLQGPFNLAFHLRGVELYTDVIDDPDFVHGLMSLLTDTFIEVGKWCKKVVGEPLDGGYYWNWRLVGGVRNVDDNSIMLGPDFYSEFIKPYNDRVFVPFDGGAHHSCGELSHLYPHLFSISQLHAMHFGNPEMQDFETVWPQLAEKKICALWDMELRPEFREQVCTGIVVREVCESLDDAKRRLDNYRKGW
jgi:hypothetical protein